MKSAIVNGEPYEVCALRREDITPGTLLCGREVRKAYRILVEDDDEWILRDMRHPKILDAATTEWLLANCNRMEPANR